MEDVTITQLANAILNTVILVVQYFIFRFLRKGNFTADARNQDTIKSIAENMNHLSRSVSVTLEAAGISPNSPSKGRSANRGHIPPPPSDISPEDLTEAAKAARKADLYRKFRA